MQSQETYFSGPALALVTIALALGNFMEVLDTTIANVALPHIAGDLGVGASQATWVITSYAVANAISVLLAGWLSQRFGQVRVFVTAVVLFTCASWLCGTATNFEMLLGFRVMQGGVSGLMVPLSQTLLLASYPRQKQGIALAIWSMTVMVAPVIGPILGGWITDDFSWPWIFYINLPVGIAIAWLAHHMLSHRETPIRKLPVDAVGLGLIVIWVGALQIMLDKGNELDWFGSPLIVALAVIATFGFALFLAWELFEKHPIVDLRLLNIRNFRAGTLAISLGYGVFFGGVVLLPLWLQTKMGYTATWAGFTVAPYGVLALLLSPAVGKNLDRIDPRLFATAAFLIFATASFLRAGFNTDATFAALALPQLVQGAGIAMFFAPLITITLSGLDPERVAFGSGLVNFFRITAGSFGAALATTFWQRREALHHTQLVDRISEFAPQATHALSGFAGSSWPDGRGMAEVQVILGQQSTLLATIDIFWVSGWLFLLMIVFIWFADKPGDGIPIGAH